MPELKPNRIIKGDVYTVWSTIANALLVTDLRTKRILLICLVFHWPYFQI